MASDHVIALSHLVGIGIGLALVASTGRRLSHSRLTRVRTEDAPRRGQRGRASARLIGHLLRGIARLAVNLTLALVSPVGLLCANQRYPLVAPVLAPFEARLAALGHRTGHARCFPLLAWHIWLVRCAGCRRRSFFHEVPAANGTGVEFKAMGTSPWRTRRCPTEYLTARPPQTTETARTAPPTRRRVRPMRPIPAEQPVAPASPPSPRVATTDKTA